jgi:long-subunit fatty acid transport protein
MRQTRARRFWIAASLIIGVVAGLTLMSRPALAAWNAGSYLKFGIGARPLGMGNSFVAVADDATAIYWNPAGLIQADDHQAFLSYADRFGLGIKEQSGGIALRWRDRFRVGFGVIHSSINDIKSTSELDERGRPIVDGTVSDAQMALMFSSAFRIHEIFTIGVTVKLLSHELARRVSNGYGVDFGWLLRPLDNLTFGLNAQNINRPRMKWRVHQEHFDRIPANFKFGGAYVALPSRLTLSADLNVPDFGDITFNSGAEYSPLDQLTLRGGLANTDLATGATFQLDRVGIDYAFQNHELGATHRFGLQLGF